MEQRELVGTALTPEDQRQVLAAYVHRMTIETQTAYPDFARRMRADGWRMPDKSDADWLASTMFRVTNSGRLDRRVHYCRTNA